MSTGLRIAVVVFVASLVQLSVVSSIHLLGGSPDLLLVVLVCVALLHGSVAGAISGFAAGLIVDAATLSTLGVTSLLLTLAGYVAGRYGETTGRDRALAPYTTIVVTTLAVGVASFLLHFLLGEEIAVRHALVTTLLPAVLMNTILMLGVWPFVRWATGAPQQPRAAREMELVV